MPAESELTKPVGKGLASLAREQARVPLSARAGMLESTRGSPVPEERVDSIESCMFLVFRCTGTDLTDDVQEILPERASGCVQVAIADLLEMSAFDVLPPSRSRQVRRQDANDEALVGNDLHPIAFVLLHWLVDEQKDQLGVEDTSRAADVDSPVVELGRCRILRKPTTVVVDGQVFDRAQGFSSWMRRTFSTWLKG